MLCWECMEPIKTSCCRGYFMNFLLPSDDSTTDDVDKFTFYSLHSFRRDAKSSKTFFFQNIFIWVLSAAANIFSKHEFSGGYTKKKVPRECEIEINFLLCSKSHILKVEVNNEVKSKVIKLCSATCFTCKGNVLLFLPRDCICDCSFRCREVRADMYYDMRRWIGKWKFVDNISVVLLTHPTAKNTQNRKLRACEQIDDWMCKPNSYENVIIFVLSYHFRRFKRFFLLFHFHPSAFPLQEKSFVYSTWTKIRSCQWKDNIRNVSIYIHETNDDENVHVIVNVVCYSKEKKSAQKNRIFLNFFSRFSATSES